MSREDLVYYEKTYNVFADIGPTVDLLDHVLSVSDTSAGPNLMRKYELPAGLETLASFGPMQDISDANSGPLRIVNTMKMLVRLGRFVHAAKFIVCEKLAVPLILGADYCDRLVEAIYPPGEEGRVGVFLANSDNKEVFPYKRKENPRSGRGQRGCNRGTRVPEGEIGKGTTIEPGAQRDFECTSRRSGLVIVRPYAPLYDNDGLVSTNEVAHVVPDKPFRLLVAKFAKYPVRIQKGQAWLSSCCTQVQCSNVQPALVRCSEILSSYDSEAFLSKAGSLFTSYTFAGVLCKTRGTCLCS